MSFSCINSLALKRFAPMPSNLYYYDSNPLWQAMGFPELNLECLAEDPNKAESAPLPATKYNDFHTLSDLTIGPELSLSQKWFTDGTNSSGSVSVLLPPSVVNSFTSSKTDSRSEKSAHPEHCDRPCRGHKMCGLCERDKIEKRKAQNRKAQRRLRIRNEAKVEQLCSKVREQSQEIDSLEELNQRLFKQIEHLIQWDAQCDYRRD